MNILDTEYIDLKLKLKSYEAKMEILLEGLSELKRQTNIIIENSNDIREDDRTYISDNFQTLIEVADIKEKQWKRF